MRKSSGEPKSIEAEIESSNSEGRDQTEDSDVPQADTPAQDAATDAEPAQSEDWWSMSQQTADWAEPATAAPSENVTTSNEPRTADVYFCGHTTLFPLNRALQAISRERLTGLLRAFWEQEPIDLLARDGEVVFVTTRDPDLYCPETPPAIGDIDAVLIDRARNQQKETGTPFFLTLAREESIGLQSASELMHHHGQQLFSELWS